MANLKDVAKYANVSISTASRIIGGRTNFTEETRNKVLEAARVLNYVPNIMARSLKDGQSKTIALLVPSIQNVIFPDITRGAEDTCRKYGYTLILCNMDENVEVEKNYIERLKSRLVDGFIVASMSENSSHIKKLHADGFPVVLINRYIDNTIDAVSIDHFKAGYEATSYLIRTGCQKVAIAAGREELNLYRQRFLGYKKALMDNRIEYDESLVFRDTVGTSGFYQTIQKALANGIQMDGIFATSDPKAYVIMKALRDAGVSIPEQVSVIGIDNVEFSSLVEPPLTTIAQPFYEMGVLAAKRVIDRIKKKNKPDEQDEPAIEMLNTDLIVRGSTR